MLRSLGVHQYVDRCTLVDVDVTKMIVRHGTLRAIAVFLVFLASVSLSESVKLRKPRRRTTTRAPYQQSRIGPVIIRVMHEYNDDGPTAGCANGNCRNAHDKFNEAISEEDNFLPDAESLRYVVHPEKYEHFVLRKNTGHANRYRRDTALTELHSSNSNDRTVVDRGSDASEVKKNVNKENFTRVQLHRIPLYMGDFPKPLSEARRTRGNLTELHSLNANDRTVVDCGSDASEVKKDVNKGNFTRVPLHKIDRYTRDLSKSLSKTSRTGRNLTKLHSSNTNDRTAVDRGGDASKVQKNKVNKVNFTKVRLHRVKLYTFLPKALSEASRTRRSLTELHSSNASDRTVVDCGSDASEVKKDVNKGNFTRVPLHKIDRYTRDLSKPLSKTSRTRRNLTKLHSSNTNDRTAVDRGGDASKVQKNVNKGNLTRVPLHRIPLYTRDLPKPLSEANRTRRSLTVDNSSRRNDSDYHAQRKAVMERYYNRQREINARYANRTVVAPRSEHNDVSQHRPVTSNATLFDLGRVYHAKDSTARDSATFRYPPTKIDPIYSNESRYNKIPTDLDTRRNVVPVTDLGFKSDANLSETRSSGNNEGNALDYLVTPTPCTNLSSSGTFAPKTRPKHAKNCTRETERSNEDCSDRSSTDNVDTEDLSGTNVRWGRCEGKIVYQHNLLLGLTGPSNLDALFEVIIQGPVCITCVEALRYNETRATVTLDSGGRGHEYAKLRLQGYEDEGFSYIIKVWGVKKTGQVCDNVD